MNIAIVGSRKNVDLGRVRAFVRTLPASVTVVSGGAIGVDRTAEDEARACGLSVISFPADWETHGKAAGMIRNKDIVSNSECVVAFWDGQSSGTENTINRAETEGKRVWINPQSWQHMMDELIAEMHPRNEEEIEGFRAFYIQLLTSANYNPQKLMSSKVHSDDDKKKAKRELEAMDAIIAIMQAGERVPENAPFFRYHVWRFNWALCEYFYWSRQKDAWFYPIQDRIRERFKKQLWVKEKAA